MKVLFLEDNESVATAVKEGLSESKIDVTVADTISNALNILSEGDYGAILVDANTESGRAMDIVDKVEVIRDPGKFFWARDPKQIPVVVIRHSGQTVPSDTQVIKGAVDYPFSTKTLEGMLKSVTGEGDAPEPKPEGPEAVLDRMNMVPGGAYVVVSDKSNAIRKAVKSYSDSGTDLLLFTASPAKVAKDRMGLDLGVEVIVFSGQEYALGSNLAAFREYIRSAESPVVVIDDLRDVIAHCGLDRTMMFLSEIAAARADYKFTFLTTVRPLDVGQNVVNVICRVLRPCYFED